jgi:hypothetical protein
MRFCAVCACSRPLRDFTLNAAGTPSYECVRCVRLSIPMFVAQVNLHVRLARARIDALQRELP